MDVKNAHGRIAGRRPSRQTAQPSRQTAQPAAADVRPQWKREQDEALERAIRKAHKPEVPWWKRSA